MTRNMAVPLWRLSVLTLLGMLCGCAAPVLHGRLDAPAPPEGLSVALLQRVQQQGESYRALEGLAKVRVSNQGQNFNATQVVLVEKPDRLRAETLSPFGNPLLVLATDGHEVSALVPGDGLFYSGVASPANLQRFTRLPLPLEDLIALLLYQVPLLEARQQQLVRDGEGNLLLHMAGDGDLRQELTFNGAHMLTSAAFLHGTELQLRVSYRDFSSDGTGYPTSVKLEMPPVGAEASLSFSEVRLNTVIPPTRFRLTAPAGYEVRPLP